MKPTPIDLRRIEKCVKLFNFDPRDIGGANHIRWWFATEDDAHYDADQQGERDCFVGDVIVLVKKENYNLRVAKMQNWVTQICHNNKTTSYIFQPTSKLTTKEE